MNIEKPPGETRSVQPKQKSSGKAEVAAIQNFTRLQQSQSEYLQWLEASEKKHDIDRYSYRKIR